MIGNDGRVYEGAGWHIEGAHTYGYNKKGLGIAFIGDFSGNKRDFKTCSASWFVSLIFLIDSLPTNAALNAAKKLLKCGVKLGELDRNYRLLGGRQVISSASPGLELYNVIQDWDNWVSAP